MKRYTNLGVFIQNIAQKFDRRVALCYDDESINYRQLNALSNQLANYFLDKGIGARNVVGIFNTKTPVGYASILACLKIGATYTNIDADNPPIRLEKILAICQPKILISDHIPYEFIRETASKLNIQLIDMSIEKQYEKCSCNNPAVTEKITGSCPAYIMFTSGSTGTPKGVLISHDNLLSFIAWSTDRFCVTPDDKFAQVSPLYFDNSVFDFYTALFNGASLVPFGKEISSDPIGLMALVNRQKCTIWFSVPSLLVYLLAMRILVKENMKHIRVIIFGGEGFPKGELKKLFDLYNERMKLVNVYGPTEGTCICSSYEITKADFKNMNKLASLGVINQNFEYLIIDEEMQEVETGSKGELCLIGPNVGLGYYDDLERTQESFVQNPFADAYREIIYKTGDLVYEKDDLLWFSGREDNQIKHMGYRIELEEIESALNGLSYVNQSVVIYDRVKRNYGKIIAYVATKDDVTESLLKNDLYVLLPDYMMPNIVEIRSELPMNANGKVDRKYFMTLRD